MAEVEKGVPVPDRRRRLGVLAICCLSLFIVSLDATIVNVALPSLGDDFGASVSGLQWTIDAYVLVVASLLLLGGSTGDRIGRKRVFQTGLVIFTGSSLLCSVAPNLPTLVAFRMLQAVGGSMLNPNALSIITNVFTDARERAMAIGVWGGIFGISAASGPLLGGLLVDSIGWRSIFWLNVPIGAAAFVLTARFVPESRAERPRRLDLPGQALAIVFLAALTYAIIEGPGRGWASPVILALFAVSVAALGGFLSVERRTAEPLLDPRFFGSAPMSGAAVIALLAFVVLAGFLFLNTLYLQGVRGDSAAMAGLATLPATAVVAVTAPLAGRITAHHGPRLPLAAGGLLLAAGPALLANLDANSSYLHLAVAYALIGLGFGLVNPPITNTAVSGMPRSQAGVASAVTSTSRQTGNVLGVALVGSLVASAFAGGGDLPVGGGRGSVTPAARDAFATATHGSWWLMAGCGLAIAVVALLTTGAWARATAARTARSLGAGAITQGA